MKYKILVDHISFQTLTFYVTFQGSGHRHFLFQLPFNKSVYTFFMNGVSGIQLMKFHQWNNRRLSKLIPRTLKMVNYVRKYEL